MHAFSSHPGVDRVVLVMHPDDISRGVWPGHLPVEIATGGASRAESVLAGLEYVEASSDHVLIHDVARPLVRAPVVTRVLEALAEGPAAAPALGVTDALWAGSDGCVTDIQDRTGLYRAQTPQGFETEAILAAHRAHTGLAADDVEVALAAGIPVTIVPGDEDNMKITVPGDFARAETILRSRMQTAFDIRLGNGFDVHRFGAGDHVRLCGLAIPYARGLQGHSDADVGLHTITDAIYGALAEGDIGRHFPATEPQWKGADSAVFLKHAVQLAAEKGYSIANIDLTLICEAPKIGPHAAAMTHRVAEITGIAADRISIKATTSERLGFTGREEGIAALATAALVAA